MSHVLTKSAKGLREASGKTTDLSDELRAALLLCKGQFVAEDLLASVPASQREALTQALIVLTDAGYLRAVAEIDTGGDAPISAPSGDQDAAQLLRAEMAARRGQRDEEAAEQVRLAEEVARQRAAEKARQEAAAAAQREAEERARREAETRARIEAEEKAKLAALERERAEAEEAARREAAERTRRVAEERARREASEKSRREAEEKARQEAEARELDAMRERLRQRAAGRRRVLAPIIVAVLLVPVLLLWGIAHVPMSGKRDEFARRATQALGLPVRIGAVRLQAVPQPQWRLDEVAIGEGEGAVRVQRVEVPVSFGGIWTLPETLDRVHLDGAVVPVSALMQLFGTSASATRIGLAEVSGDGMQVTNDGKPVSPLSQLSAHFIDGRLRDVGVQGADEEHGKFAFLAQRPGAVWQIEAQAGTCLLPFGLGLTLRDCVLRASPGDRTLHVSSFAARHYDGDLLLDGDLSWAGPWSLSGKVQLKRQDVSQIAPAWFRDGFVNGSGEFVASGATAQSLFAGLQLAGDFSVAPGVLAGVDFDRVVQGRGIGEQFRFDVLSGKVRFDTGRADLTDLHLNAGALAADGLLTIAADKSVSGRTGIEVRTGSTRLSSSLVIGGSVTKPEFRR